MADPKKLGNGAKLGPLPVQPMMRATGLVGGVARRWSRPNTDARQKEPKDMATKKPAKPAAKKTACTTSCKPKPAAKKPAKKAAKK